MTGDDEGADRLALHELVARHGHLVDSGDVAGLAEVVAPDVVYYVSDLGGSVLVGLTASASSRTPSRSRSGVTAA